MATGQSSSKQVELVAALFGAAARSAATSRKPRYSDDDDDTDDDDDDDDDEDDDDDDEDDDNEEEASMELPDNWIAEAVAAFGPALLEHRNADGQTLLHLAVGQTRQALLEAGADPLIRDNWGALSDSRPSFRLPSLNDLRDASSDQGNRPTVLVERDRHAAAVLLDDVATFRGRSPLEVTALLRDSIADEQWSVIGQAFAALLPSTERAAWIEESLGEESAMSVFGERQSTDEHERDSFSLFERDAKHPSLHLVARSSAHRLSLHARQGCCSTRTLMTARATVGWRSAWSTNGLAGCDEPWRARRHCPPT